MGTCFSSNEDIGMSNKATLQRATTANIDAITDEQIHAFTMD